MIFKSLKQFQYWLDDSETLGLVKKRDIWLTSGGFDPLHVGHLRCIQDTALMATNPVKYPSQLKGFVVVLVNCDNFLINKKGYAFMPLEERMEIINGIKGVDAVLPWPLVDKEDTTVINAILELRPKVFTKGGDRIDQSTIPEWSACKQVGCELITGVGGEKIQSSSELVEKATDIEAAEVIGYAMGFTDGKNESN